MRILLASASPRRLELLAAAGLTCDVDPVDVDESRLTDESPAEYVERVAWLKAEAGAARHPGRVVIGADTAVVLGETIFGKPKDAADAVRMLTALAGRAHEVLTGVAVVAAGSRSSAVERTTVWFDSLTAEQIEAYVRTGEPMDKAGAYAIQGRASRFIPRIEGSYTNVVGLPVATVASLLAAIGVDVDGLRTAGAS